MYHAYVSCQLSVFFICKNQRSRDFLFNNLLLQVIDLVLITGFYFVVSLTC